MYYYQMTPWLLRACYCLPGSLEKVQNNGISLPPKRKESLQLCQRTSHICRQKGDVGDQHCGKWFNHQVRKAEEDPSRKRGQLLHPKRLHLAQQSFKEWIWVGQILAHSRKEWWIQALSSFQQLFATIFIISLILSIFLWDWYVVLLHLFYWREKTSGRKK